MNVLRVGAIYRWTRARTSLRSACRTASALAAATVLALAFGAAVAGTLRVATLPAGDHPGSRDRVYAVYVPDRVAQPAPMVMALHGCRQTHEDVLRDWGLVAAADRHGFVLVVPHVTSFVEPRNPGCWGFWLDEHRHQGRGEVEDLHRIARQVESRLAIDPARRYVAGLSSGGAVSHNEYWAAAASAAGLPFGEDAAAVSLSGRCPGAASFHAVRKVVSDMHGEIDHPYPVPLLVMQGANDCTVLAEAARRLRDAHLAAFAPPTGFSRTAASAAVSRRPCTPVHESGFNCEHARHTLDGTRAGHTLVETVIFDGPLMTPDPTDQDHGHYWVSGPQGRDGPWTQRRGPVFPEIAWDFFDRHPRRPGLASGVPVPRCERRSATVIEHLWAGRLVRGGWMGTRALAEGDRADMGPLWNVGARVTLHEGAPGRWRGRMPGACAR